MLYGTVRYDTRYPGTVKNAPFLRLALTLTAHWLAPGIAGLGFPQKGRLVTGPPRRFFFFPRLIMDSARRLLPPSSAPPPPPPPPVPLGPVPLLANKPPPDEDPLVLDGTGDEENRRWSFFSIMGRGVIFRPRLLPMLLLWAFSSFRNTGDGGVGHITPPEPFGRERTSSASFTVIEMDSAFMVVGEKVVLRALIVAVGADAGDTENVLPSAVSRSVVDDPGALGAHLPSGV